jgi:hypothetical protein
MAMQQGKAHIMALYYMQALLLPTDIHGACNVLMIPFCFLASFSVQTTGVVDRPGQITMNKLLLIRKRES